MLIYFTERLFFAFACGLIATVYREVLAYEPAFNWWWKFGAKYETKPFFAPIWGCVKCIGGQIALWSYLLIFIDYTKMPGLQQVFLNIFGLVLSICGAIFTAMVLSPIVKNLK